MKIHALILMLLLAVATFGQETASLPDNPTPKMSSDAVASKPEPPKPVIRFRNEPSKPWYKDWKALSLLGYAIGSAGANIWEAHECRLRNGIGPCEGGYGAIEARGGVNLVGSVGLALISLWGRHLGFKEWAAPSLGFSTYQTYEALHQGSIGCPTGQHFLYGTKYTCVPNAQAGSW